MLFINVEQFDQLLAEVAALPRLRLAPLNVGDVVSRSTGGPMIMWWLPRSAARPVVRAGCVVFWLCLSVMFWSMLNVWSTPCGRCCPPSPYGLAPLNVGDAVSRSLSGPMIMWWLPGSAARPVVRASCLVFWLRLSVMFWSMLNSLINSLRKLLPSLALRSRSPECW